MKKYIALALFLVSLLALGERYHDKHAARYSRAQQSTVLVESTLSFGSGFVLKRDNGLPRVFVVTAAHVVAGVNDVQVHKTFRVDGHKAGTGTFTAHVIARDKALDLALLWLDAPEHFFVASAFDGATILPVGTPVFHCGNFNGPVLEDSITTGVVSQVGVENEKFPWLFVDQTSAIAIRGCSGGAIFSERSGSVVGVLVGTFTPGANFFVPARAVHTFCVVQHVEWAFSGDSCPSDAKLLQLQESAKEPATVAVMIPVTVTVTAPSPEPEKKRSVIPLPHRH